METAITELEITKLENAMWIALEILETNELINRAERNTMTADIEAKCAADIRQGLEVLNAAQSGPSAKARM